LLADLTRCDCVKCPCSFQLYVTLNNSFLHYITLQYWPCICLEEGCYLWRLAAHCRHSSTLQQSAMKGSNRRRLFADNIEMHRSTKYNSAVWKRQSCWPVCRV